MKKLGMLALAAVLVAMFTIPAWAIESEFGGYWRTRFYTNQNFTGEDETEALDFTGVDTRTRLYYTAIFHENLKFVNKFEFNTTWGDTNGGDIGADGTGNFRIKNSYIDANTGPVNWKVGIHGGTLARGFLFTDDFSGMTITYKGERFEIPFMWIRAFEGGYGKDANDLDADYYAIAPRFTIADMVNLNPYFLYFYSNDISGWNPFAHGYNLKLGDIGAEDTDLWYLGLDGDMDLGMASIWFTGIYQGGTLEVPGAEDIDVKAWLAALGGSANIGMFDIHGQGFYASGDDDLNDNDAEAFFVPSQNYGTGQSYYWAEIMGLGIFDNQASNNSPLDKISNVWAVNLGASVKPMDKLKVALDVWYAELAEDVVTLTGDEESSLGTEVDLVLTYEVVQNLNLDLVGAYLFAGDATTMNADNDANPWEVGAQLSLSF